VQRIASLVALLIVCSVTPAPTRAEPAMFEASLIIHMWGNDSTTGVGEFGVYTVTAVPPAQSCTYFTNWGPTTGHSLVCGQTTKFAGGPATGSGAISIPTEGSPPLPIALPSGALGVTRSVRFWTSTTVYATFANEAGSFFAGGGPGDLSFHPKNPQGGTIYIQAGKNQFGGSMGLLGKLGDHFGTGPFDGTHSWNMVPVMGRSAGYRRTITDYGYTQNQLAWLTYRLIGTGFPWTTGMVTVYGTWEDWFSTVVRRTGYEMRTWMGGGNIQLVTPQITHWRGDGHSPSNTASVGILNLHFVPEPGAVWITATGFALLLLLHRGRRR